MPDLSRLGLACALVAGVQSTSAAQSTAVSLDASIGTGGGQTNGIYLERRKQALAADVAFAASVHEPESSGLFVGANVSYHSAGASTDVCIPDPDGDCTKPFPSFTVFGSLIGWESATSAVRVSSGLAFAKAEDSNGSLAYQGRIDGAMPMFSHVALIGSLRAMYVPNVAGDRFTFFALGVGIRVY